MRQTLERAIGVLGGASIIFGALSPAVVPWYWTIIPLAIGFLTMGFYLWIAPNDIMEFLYRFRRKDLVPLVELKAMASKRGWNLGSLHVLDLIRALTEAGVRGHLRFYGRYTEDTTTLMNDRPRRYVALKDWENLRVSPNGIMDYDCQDNSITQLSKFSPHGDRVYSDVHVARKGLRRWFRKHAREFRGQHEAEKEY
jgi:hypothetical protein